MRRCSSMVSPRSPPPKLEEIWLWGLGRDDPNGDVFPNPNPGIDLTVEVSRFSSTITPTSSTAKITRRSSVTMSRARSRERDRGTAGERGQGCGRITPPRPETPREQRFLEEFERSRKSSRRRRPFPGETASQGAGARATNRVVASGSGEEAIIKKAAMEAYYFSLTRSTSALTANDSRSAASCVKAADGAACGERAGREDGPRDAQHGNDGRV